MGSHIPHKGAHRDHLRNVMTGKMNLPDRAVPRMDRRVRPFDALAANQVRATLLFLLTNHRIQNNWRPFTGIIINNKIMSHGRATP